MTEHALNHRFRRLRAQAIIVREGRQQGFDMRDMFVEEGSLPTTQESVDKQSMLDPLAIILPVCSSFISTITQTHCIPRRVQGVTQAKLTCIADIAKYFGQSTADGIQFQFRGIKKDADLLRQTERNGGDVANCLDISGGTSAMSTPCKPTPTRPRAPRSTGKGSKRKPPTTFIKRSDTDDEDEKEECDDWSDKDDSPSKRTKTGALPGQRNGTPSRRAAVRAVATIADASAQLQDNEVLSDFEAPAPIPDRVPIAPPTTIAPASIFGPVTLMSPVAPFSEMAEDPYLGGSADNDGYTNNYFDDGFI